MVTGEFCDCCTALSSSSCRLPTLQEAFRGSDAPIPIGQSEDDARLEKQATYHNHRR